MKRFSLISLMLCLSLVGAFGGAYYGNYLYLSEVLQFLTVVLFVFLLVHTTVFRRELPFVVLIPLFAIMILMPLYAYVFYMRTGAPILPSVLAQRPYVFFLIGPIVYMLHLGGWEHGRFREICITAMIITTFTYIVVYFMVDLETWKLSGSDFQKGMVTYDSMRGFRLKGPRLIFLSLILFLGIGFFSSRKTRLWALRLSIISICIFLLAINFPRAILAAFCLSLLGYSLFLRNSKRLGAWFIISPPLIISALLLAILVSSLFVSYVEQLFSDDWSYVVRIQSSNIAVGLVQKYPMLGFGAASHQSLSYQDLFGASFYPGDIGLLGVAFRFGALGVIVYLLWGVWLIRNLLQMTWSGVGQIRTEDKDFLDMLLLICLIMLVVSPVQARFIHSEGIGLSAFAWGMALSWKSRKKDEMASLRQAETRT